MNGKVYLARNKSTGEKVAVKTLTTENLNSRKFEVGRECLEHNVSKRAPSDWSYSSISTRNVSYAPRVGIYVRLSLLSLKVALLSTEITKRVRLRVHRNQ